MNATLQTTGLFITLRAYGNPDYRQYTDLCRKRVVKVQSLTEAVQVCAQFIYNKNLGGGNWGRQSGCVFDGKRMIARVSYNGRLWNVDANGKTTTEIEQPGVKTAAQHESEGWKEFLCVS